MALRTSCWRRWISWRGWRRWCPTADAFDAPSRGIRAAQQLTWGYHAGAARPGCAPAQRAGRREARHATPRGDELGATPEAGVRDRDRPLRPLRWAATGAGQY